jgi:hypothetical protein
MFESEEIALNDYVAHEVVLDQLYKPQLLILPINKVSSNELIITGKLFEYITTGNPILGIGPPQGDAARILEKTGTGRMFDYGDIDGIRNFVKECFVQWKNGMINEGVRLFPEYERRNLTKRLATLFDECVGFKN